jgi:hypothetical protein
MAETPGSPELVLDQYNTERGCSYAHKGSVLGRVRVFPLAKILGTRLEPQSNYFFTYLSRDSITGFVLVKSSKKKVFKTRKIQIIRTLIIPF